MRRRITAVIAVLAVAGSGLIGGGGAASAAVTSASISPSTWAVGSSPAATVTYVTDASVPNPSIVVEWDWTVAFASLTSPSPTSTITGGYSCDNSGITFTSTGAWTTSGTVQCLYESSNSSDPSKHRVTLSNATTAAGTVEVFFPADQVTAQYIPRGYGTWTIGSGSTSLSSVRVNLPQEVVENAPPLITINFDANGGQCRTNQVTGYQTTWTTAPAEGDCSRPGFAFAGYNTAADGSGTAVAASGNLNLTGDNTLYAQWVQPRAPGAPTDVVATGGLKNVKVSWKAPADAGTSPIANYLVQANPGGASCITNMASANMLECTYTSLVPGTKYTFKVQGLNRAGWSAFSADSNTATPYNILLDTISRPEVKFLFFTRGSNLQAEGRAPGLPAGTVLTPVMQIGTNGAFVPLTKDATKVNGDGAFTWSRKIDKRDNGKPVSLYFTYGDAKTETLTARLGATIGLPSAPRDVKVKSGTEGFTVSWQPPARDGGSPIIEYVMTSDLRASSSAPKKFVSCTVKAPTTSCTMPGNATVFDPKKEYTFSVVAKTERGTSPQATKKWKGEIYRLNIFKRSRVDSEVMLSFSATGWPKDARGFEIQAKVGPDGAWKKQGTARLDPDYVEPIGDWAGMLPKSVTAGTEVYYRVKSDKGFSNVVKFRLGPNFEYSLG